MAEAGSLCCEMVLINKAVLFQPPFEGFEGATELTFEGGGISYTKAVPAREAGLFNVGETYFVRIETTVVRKAEA